MRILGGALPSTDAFLHVGYISAYPRKFSPEHTGGVSDLMIKGTPVDVAAALQLKDETATPQADAVQAPTAGIIWIPGGLSQATAVFLAAFAVGVLALYKMKALPSSKGKRRAAVVGAVCAVVACIAIVAAGLHVSSRLSHTFPLPPPDVKPPWEGVAPLAYADPVSATRVLMHGIVGDALANAGRSVRTLAQLKDEVGLPVANPTAGERHALQTYGLDGWGKPFRLESHNLKIVDRSALLSSPGHPVGGSAFREWNSRIPHYLLTSAGPDGAFDTADDLCAAIKAYTDTNWDEGFRGFYLYNDGGTYAALMHRWRGTTFQYTNREQAKTLTGGDLYDKIPLNSSDEWHLDSSLPPDTPKSVAEAAQRIYGRLGSAQAVPLVLLIQPEETAKP